MLTFEYTIMHILDCEHNTLVISDECMEDSETLDEVLQSKANKVFVSAQKKKGSFKEGSVIFEWIERFKDEQLTFEEMSKKIAHDIFDAKMKYGMYQASDFILSVVLNEGRRYLLGIDNSNHKGIMHDIHQDEKTCNTLCENSSLISMNLTKDDRVFLIELSDMSVNCIENKVEIEADKVNFFADIILQSTSEPSYKEAVKSITKTAEKLVDKYEMDDMEVMPNVKRIIRENVEAQTPICIEDIAEIVFAKQPLAKGDFKEELKTQGVSKDVEVEYVKATKADGVQKIKTDRGIELIIPIDFMNSKDLVEFQNHPDGTFSIQLKNIMRISRK